MVMRISTQVVFVSVVWCLAIVLVLLIVNLNDKTMLLYKSLARF